MFLYSLMATPLIDRFEPIGKWLTVGVLAALVLVGAILFFVKRSVVRKYVKYAFFGAFAYLLVLAILFFSLELANRYSDEYAAENWLDKDLLVRFVLAPLLVLSSVTLVGTCVIAIVSKWKPDSKKAVSLAVFALIGVCFVVALVCCGIYYAKKIDGDGYYNSNSASVKQIVLWICAAALAVGVIALTLFDKRTFFFDSRSIAYAGVLCAMSFALSYVKLFRMPQGGSITLVSLLPLMLYSYLFGAKKGVFVGFVYGVLQSVQDPWIIHPAQFLLDYPVAFAAIGVAGLFKSSAFCKTVPQVKFAFGAILAGTLRFLCHVLSGVFAFEAYANGQNVLVYSLAYNSYVFIDLLLVVVAGIVLLSSKSFQAIVGAQLK